MGIYGIYWMQAKSQVLAVDLEIFLKEMYNTPWKPRWPCFPFPLTIRMGDHTNFPVFQAACTYSCTVNE